VDYPRFDESDLVYPLTSCPLVFTHVVDYAYTVLCWQLRLQLSVLSPNVGVQPRREAASAATHS
jgi:hypothetical protein